MSWGAELARPAIVAALDTFDVDLPGLKRIIGRSGHEADAVIAAKVRRWWGGRLLTVVDQLEARVTVAELRDGLQAWLSTREP